MKIDLSIHQQAALVWLFSSSVAFSPVIAISPKPNAGLLLWTGIATVTAMIAVVPLLLRWSTFRNAFCWTDALSGKERSLLTARRAKDFYQAAYDDGYVTRIKPYLFRIAAVMFLQMVPELMSWKCENDLLQGVLVFSSWYAGGVFMLIGLTLPWPQALRYALRKK